MTQQVIAVVAQTVVDLCFGNQFAVVVIEQPVASGVEAEVWGLEQLVAWVHELQEQGVAWFVAIAALAVVEPLPPAVRHLVPYVWVIPHLEALHVPSVVQLPAMPPGPEVPTVVGTWPTHLHSLPVLPLVVVCLSLVPSRLHSPHTFLRTPSPVEH